VGDLLTGLAGLDLFAPKYNWKSELSAQYEMSRAIHSYAGTVEELINYSDHRPTRLELEFLFQNKAEEYDFLTFWMDKRGQWKKFWLPSPSTGFFLDTPTVIGVPSVIVRGNRFAEFYKGFERIFIQLDNGDRLSFQINSIAQDQPLPGKDTLNLGAALDRIVDQADIALFSLLLCGRFEKDVAELAYITMAISECKISFLELPKEYPA